MSTIKKSFNENGTKDQEYLLPCIKCDNKTYHKVLCSINEQESNEFTGYYHDHEIIHCMGCRQVSFRSCWSFSEDEVYDPEIDDLVSLVHEELFPGRVIGRKEIKDSHLLPDEVQKIYSETYIAYVNKAYLLAGVGLRALVEAICKDRKAKGKDLEEKIDNLVELKILTEEGAEILHSTRIMGNRSAHELLVAEVQDLDTALSLVEHLLMGVYILPQKTQGLPKRKKEIVIE